RPRARICCLLSSPKMLAIPAGNHALHRRVNVLGRRYFTGRFSGVHDWPVLGVHRGPEGPGWTRLRALTLSHAVGPNRLPQLTPPRKPAGFDVPGVDAMGRRLRLRPGPA